MGRLFPMCEKPTTHKKIKNSAGFYFTFNKTLIWKIKIAAVVSLLIQ